MKYVWCLLLLIGFSQCANQTSPGGGPQDKKPPELQNSNPKNNQKNFKGKAIELSFDEYVELKNANEEILISPSIGKDLKIVAKKKKVTISPKENWKENTTYSINFREAVQDITEKTPANNLRIAFSTGETIDSLQINGSIFEVFKNEIPEKITVALYASDSFNIFKHQPTYFTKADKTGKFSIQNLKQGEYYIYAFEDRNKNLVVESKSEKFGFLAKQIMLPNKDSIKIPLIRVDTRPIKVTSFRPSQKITTLRLNKSLTSIKVTPYDKSNYLIYYGAKQDEVIFLNRNEELSRDSTLLNLELTDSLNVRKDTSVYLKFTNTKMPAEKFKSSSSKIIYDIPTKKITSTIQFNKPLSKINFDSLYLQIDSTTFENIKAEDLSYDSLTNRLIISKQFDSKEEKPTLIFGKGAFISVDKDSSQSRTEGVKLFKAEELGSLSIKVTSKETSFVIELINGSKEIVTTLYNVKDHTFKNLQPDQYSIRITIDKNRNKKWDCGNFFLKEEPEPIIQYKTFDGKTTTPIRANWEVGPLEIKF
jgi:uncharacterized protein (DUF2141 family)